MTRHFHRYLFCAPFVLLFAGCESTARKLEDNSGAILGTAVGTGAGLVMKNNADKGENLDLYTGVGAMAGYAAGKSYDDARREEQRGVTDEQARAFVDGLDENWRDPVALPPPRSSEEPAPLGDLFPFLLPNEIPVRPIVPLERPRTGVPVGPKGPVDPPSVNSAKGAGVTPVPAPTPAPLPAEGESSGPAPKLR